MKVQFFHNPAAAVFPKYALDDSFGLQLVLCAMERGRKHFALESDHFALL